MLKALASGSGPMTLALKVQVLALRVEASALTTSLLCVCSITRGQSNLTKSASRGPIPRLGVTPGGRKLYH